MKIKNTTRLPNRFLHRLAAWTLKRQFTLNNWVVNDQLAGVQIYFRGSRGDWRGLRNTPYYYIHIPLAAQKLPQEEVALLLIGHLARIANATAEAPVGELAAVRQPVAKEFLDRRDALLAKWIVSPTPKDPLTQQRHRLQRAETHAAKWVRKAKLAQTKLKLWKRREKLARLALEAARTRITRENAAQNQALTISQGENHERD